VLRLAIDYRLISVDNVLTTGCDLVSPETYNSKVQHHYITK